MDDLQIKLELIEQLIEISKEAGKAILEVYNTDFDYQIKEDLSPLTKADTISNHIICERLKGLSPDIPILSEENSDIPFNIRSLWKQYWLVDPLDGTKEFIKHNGEFTVNIALMENNIPIIGVILVPIINETYWGSKYHGSYHIKNESSPVKIKVSPFESGIPKILSSRSHPSKKLETFLKKIKKYELLKTGSSLKFCYVAAGKADLYPRLGPTSEWDVAAGEAIVKYAGGDIKNLVGNSLKYNSTKSYLNPSFIVTNNPLNTNKYLRLLD